MTTARMAAALAGLVVFGSLCAETSPKGGGPSLEVGTVAGAPGTTVTVPVNYLSDGTVTGYNFTIAFDPARLEPVACVGGASTLCNIDAANARVAFIALEFVVPMPVLGDDVHEIVFRIPDGIPDGSVPVLIESASFADGAAVTVPPSALSDGAVTIGTGGGAEPAGPEIRARPVFGLPGDTIDLVFEFINVDDIAVGFQFDLVANDPRLSLVSCEAFSLAAVTILCNETLAEDRGRFVALNFSLEPIPSGTFGTFTVQLDPAIAVPAELDLSIENFLVSDAAANEVTPSLENRIVLVNVRDDVLTGAPGDAYGFRTVADGALLAVSAPERASAGASTGAVDILRREGTSYVLEDTLIPPAGFQANGFGAAIAIQGDTVVVGAPDTPDPVAKGLTPLGAAVFQRTLQGWAFKTPIAGDGRTMGDAFGASVAISGTRIAVGAPSFASGDGAVFVFDLASGQPMQEDLLRPSGPVPKGQGAGFGAALAFDKGRLAVGAPGAIGSAIAGTVSVYDQLIGNLQLGSVLSAPASASGDEFGAAIALSGGSLVVGAPGVAGSGAAFMFDGQLATINATLLPGVASAGGRFGASLSALDGALTVGAPAAAAIERDADPISGRVSGFQMIDGAVVTGATTELGLTAIDLEELGAFAQQGFGGATTRAAGAIVIGAPETASRTGSIAIFTDGDFVFSGRFEGTRFPEIVVR